MATRSRYRLFTPEEKLRIIEEAENIENRAEGKSMMRAKVVFVTGAKNKMRLEKNSNRQAFCGQKARHLELEKRLCVYVNDKRQY